jgi:pilus assembly protein Flp/PilA
MRHQLERFWNDQAGATAIEYAMIASVLSIAIMAAVGGIGSKLNTSFTSVQTGLP